MSSLRVTSLRGRTAGVSPTLPDGAVVTGVITATTFSGNATGLSGTPDIAVRNITGVAATFTGVLTYEDVTNIDSVGLITARTGIKVLAGGINAVGVVTATSFVGTTLATNDVITFGKAVDFLGSASSEDKIDIDFTPESIDNINNESIFDSLNSGDVYEVQGDYVPGPNEFTVNDAGADYLYILGSGRERIENIFTSSTNILISDEQIALDQFV